MALKYVLDTIEGLPEAVSKEYTEQNGKFYLQTEGLVPKDRLDEFRDNNIALKKDKAKLEERLEGFKDYTPEEIEALKKRSENGGKELTEDEKKAIVESEVEKRVGKMKEDSENRINDLSGKLSESDKLLSKLVIEDGLKTAGIDLKVRPEAVIDFINRGKEVFKLVDGKAVPMSGQDIVYGPDGKTPLSIKDWATELSSKAPHLFETSSGSGQRQRNSGQSGGAGDSKLRGIEKMNASRAK